MLPEIHDFLGCRTPDAWVQAAVQQQEVMLLDHKNCEFKAASTALSLIAKYGQHLDLINYMSRLAREELVHHEQVLRILKKRKIGLRPISASRYASGLRAIVRTHEPHKLVDTLVVGAFIEARSCERFYALAPLVDEELGRYYRYLLKSESRHYEDYLALAMDVAKTAKLKNPEEDIQQRIAHIREVEKQLILSEDDTFRFHSGVPVQAA